MIIILSVDDVNVYSLHYDQLIEEYNNLNRNY